MAQRQLSEETGAQAMHDMHVYGVITIGLELCLCLENFLPILVVFCWKRSRERTVGDKLLACLSATYILSALVPTPLGLVSYFHGSWYGGAATCECFQVTSTWCSLSALAVVTYLSVDLHLTACARQPRDQQAVGTCSTGDGLYTHSAPAHNSCCASSGVASTGKDLANVVLFLVFTVTLVVASLPVVGYGPEVMPNNLTCDSWLLDTPVTGRARAYFVAFLVFGFLNLLVVLLSVAAALTTLRVTDRAWQRWEGERRYTEETSCSCGGVGDGSGGGGGGFGSCSSLVEEGTESGSRGYKMTWLILVNQGMWLPALVIVTVQKLGYQVTDATMMYAILCTSLPGLLNPLLLGLLYKDYRQGYRHVLLRLCCCCCPRNGDFASAMKDLRPRGVNSLRQPDAEERTSNGSALSIDNLSSAGKTLTIPAIHTERVSEEDTLAKCHDYNSYIVVEVPHERTPLQAQALGGASVQSRPIITSLYDEYGELSVAPKTELLSPCGSEECLLNPELFRSQTESIV